MIINQFYFSTFSPAHETALSKKIAHTQSHLSKLLSCSADTLTLLPSLSFASVSSLLDSLTSNPSNSSLLENTQVLLQMASAAPLSWAPASQPSTLVSHIQKAAPEVKQSANVHEAEKNLANQILNQQHSQDWDKNEEEESEEEVHEESGQDSQEQQD